MAASGDGSASEDTTVLIVEDDTDVVKTYRLWLEERYDIHIATEGSAALDAVDDSVDVVLLDRLMPGLSGSEVLERIRNRNLGCRVAMVTAVEPDFDVIEMGFDAYLTKPVSQETLVDTIEKLVTRSDYTERLNRYTSLLARREALQAEKDEHELADSEEYAALEAELEEVGEGLDTTVIGVDDSGGFLATIRGIDEAAEKSEQPEPEREGE
ncbi:MAG: response regulator transcription factor [Halobacteriales archaeon]